MKSPAGAWQWHPKNVREEHLVPDAHVPGKKHPPFMLTTDLALRFDPGFEPISRKFWQNPQLLEEAFAKAWFKLTHRDMGPRSRYLGPEVPEEAFIWQDPLPEATQPPLTPEEVQILKEQILASGLRSRDLVYIAWSAAGSYRDSDKRGGANGARIRLAPQKDWEVNEPATLQKVLDALGRIKVEFESNGSGRTVSLADLIVLAGTSAVERAAQKAGFAVEVPFLPGRQDATQEQTEVDFYVGQDRRSGQVRWYASRADLVFAANSQLRAYAEVYASDPNREKFVRDFVAAWRKVMNLDRFDVHWR